MSTGGRPKAMTSTAPARCGQRTRIASPIAATADLSSRAGIALSLRNGVAELGPDLLVEEDRVRRLADLAPGLLESFIRSAL